MGSKYYVYYRELCLVKVREFTYYVDMQDWLAAYLIKHQDSDDYGVDAVFKGSVQYITDSIPVERCKKAKAVADDEFKDNLVEAIEDTGKARKECFERSAKELEDKLSDKCDLSIEGVSVDGGYDGTHFP